MNKNIVLNIMPQILLNIIEFNIWIIQFNINNLIKKII